MDQSNWYEWNKVGAYPRWANIVTIIILLAMIIGCSVCYFLLLNEVLGKVPFSLHSFLFKCLLVYVLSVFLHEIGHLVMAKRFGYPFWIFKAGSIWAFNNSFRNINWKPSRFLSGGFVMLNFNEVITSKNKLDQFMKKDFKYISFGGMIFNILLVTIGILFMFDPRTIDFGYLLICYNIMILVAQLLNPSDLTKFWFIHKNPEKAAVVFTEELSINRKVNRFLEKLFHSFIDESLSKKMVDQYLLAIIQRVIEYNLIHHQENSKEIERFISWFNDHFDNIITLGMGIRISAERLMHMLIEYNMVDPKDIKSSHKIPHIFHKHPFHADYLQFFSYRRKMVELETIRKERGNNGLPF